MSDPIREVYEKWRWTPVAEQTEKAPGGFGSRDAQYWSLLLLEFWQAIKAHVEAKCVWTEDYYYYYTSCGKGMSSYDNMEPVKDYEWCLYCGKRIEIVKPDREAESE